MAKDPTLPVRHILESRKNIEADTRELDFDSFRDDRRALPLVEHNIEVISEASRRIPDNLKTQYLHIPWTEIAAIGNILRHQYHQVVAKILWDTRNKSLPPLKEAAILIERELRKTE